MENSLKNAGATQIADTPERVLVILHIYYEKYADYYLSRLSNISDCEWDLTVTGNSLSEEIRQKVLSIKPDARFIQTANLGYDVWPFICAVQQTDLDRYSFVIKLHTKNQDGILTPINGLWMTGKEWRAELVDVLIGSPKRFSAIRELFNTREDVGMTYSMSVDRTLGFRAAEDTELLDTEMERLNFKAGPKHFCAGTMFAVRASALKWLQDERITEDRFQTTGSSHGMGTLAHAYERLLCIAVTLQGYSIILVKNSLWKYVYLKAKKMLQPSMEWLFSINYRDHSGYKTLRICGFDFKLSQ